MPALCSGIPAFLLAGDFRSAYLPLTLLLVFGTAKLAVEICEKFGQSGIVGEILAGVVLGPGVLNWVHPNDALSALAQMGVMFLLFRVGLQITRSDLVRVGFTALSVAVLGVGFCFFAVWAAMAFAGASRMEAIFVAAALVPTSAGITAHILRAEGLITVRASQVIFAAAVMDDVLGLLVLAVVSNMARGHVNVAELISTIVLAAAFVVLAASFGVRALQRLLPHVERRLAAAEAQFNLAIILLFGLAVLAVYAGVAAIIGAFLAGIALSEIVTPRVHELSHGITELLVPFFLAGIGLRVEPSAFRNHGILWLTGALLVIAVLCKVIGCGLGAVQLGIRNALRVGVGMVPRGEVGMIVAQLGLTLGVIHKPAYAMIVILAVATTLLAPSLVRLAFAGSARSTSVKELALQQDISS